MGFVFFFLYISLEKEEKEVIAQNNTQLQQNKNVTEIQWELKTFSLVTDSVLFE